jgi:hypothetical protein
MLCSQDRQVIRGDTDNFTITFKSESGTPINIEGYTVWFTVRDSIPNTSVEDDSGAVIQVKNETHSAAILGETLIQISSSDTNISPKTYFYDIQYKKPDGSIHSTGYYKYMILPDITRGIS